MADETRRSIIEIIADTAGVVTGLTKGRDSFTEFNQAVESTQKVVRAVSGIFEAFGQIVGRGQNVSEVASAFENLSQKAGVDAEQSLQKLSAAAGGLISNLDLMRASNEALLAGLTPEMFEKVAGAADQLGDAVGVGTKKAMDDLTTAMNTGVTKGLERTYGLVIDNKKALEDYAKEHGVAVNALTELGQREANRIAILKALEDQQKSTGQAVETVGDQFQKIGVIVDNLVDSFAQWLNEQPQLVAMFKALAQEASHFATGLEVLFNTSSRAQLFNLQNQINAERGRLTHRDGIEGALRETFGSGGDVQKLRDLERQYAELQKTMADVGETQTDNKDGIIDYGKAAEEAGKKASAAFDRTKAELEGLAQSSLIAIDKMSNLDFAGGFSQFFDAGITAANSGGNNVIIEPLRRPIQNTVDFFSDLLTPMFEGEAANFEDIFIDAAKRIAIGFAAELLAAVAKAQFPALIAQITKFGGTAGGLGSFLGQTVMGGGGGMFGALFGGGTSGIGPVASGDAYAGMLAGGGAGLGATFSAIMPYAGAAAAAYFAGTGIADFAQGNKLDFAQQAALAIPTFGASFLSDQIGDFFGFGDSEKSKERKARDALIDQIFGGDASFQGVGGKIDISNQFQTSGKFGGAGTALVDALGQTLGGGGKLGDDLTAIFEQAVTQADNFNEVIVNTLSLMGKLGADADQTKDVFKEMFLDGEVSLEQFKVGIENLNILAQENLIGENSVADALGIVAKSFDAPRVQIKGLELLFKELGERGIDSASEIVDFMTSNFGPEVGAVFEQLTAMGYDTWEEIKNASIEQLVQIFEALQALPHEAQEAAEEAGENLEQGFQDGASGATSALDRVKRNLRDVQKEAEKTAGALKGIAGSRTGGNQNPNERPA